MLKIGTQPYSVGASVAMPYSDGMAGSLSYLTPFGDTVRMYKRDGNTMFVPRGVVDLSLIPPGQDFRSKGAKQFLPIVPKLKARDEDQQQALLKSLAYLRAGTNHIIEAPTGFGKCACKGERVLMYNGQLRKVEDIKVGDLLMGPDSKPRRVLALGTGDLQSYELRTSRGEVLRFNEDHILSLQLTGGAPEYGAPGSRVLVKIKDYLKWSKYKKHCYKMWKPDRIDYPEKDLLVDPYVLGLLLGDGGMSTESLTFSSADPELIHSVSDYAGQGNMRHMSGYDYSIVGRLKSAMSYLGLLPIKCESRYVPLDYLASSYEQRLQLIAGLIDSDGHHIKTCFDYVSKSPRLAEDLCRLAWSVGLAAVSVPVKKQCVNNGAWGEYHRVTISGDTWKIPTRLKRKQAPVRQQKKNHLLHGFEVIDIGVQTYFGFQLDHDHLYLSWNCFVTHNTFLGVSLALLLNVPTLIVVTKEDLVHAWRKMLLNPPDAPSEPGMGLSPAEIGHVQADKCDWQGKRIVIGMIHSLVIDGKYPPEFWSYFGFGIFDEVHRLGADTFQEVCYKLHAFSRLGLSATPERKDRKDRVFQAHIGPVLVKGTKVPMKPKILVKQTGWRIPDGMKYSPQRMAPVQGLIGRNTMRNALIVEFVLQSFNAGRITVVMSTLVDGHLHYLFKALTAAGITGDKIGFYIGQNTSDKQLAKINLDAAKAKPVVLATFGMTKEGTDVPEWDTLVLAMPTGDVQQAIGRVMRFKKDKKQPVVLDLVDGSRIFQNYYLGRLKQYYSVGADVVQMQ